jgi:hypothetical protein
MPGGALTPCAIVGTRVRLFSSGHQFCRLMDSTASPAPDALSVAPPSQTSKAELVYVFNTSGEPMEMWACDGPRQTLRPLEQTTWRVPLDCATMHAEQFDVLYRGKIPGRGGAEASAGVAGARKRSAMMTYVPGGTTVFPMRWDQQPVVCFENQTEDVAYLKVPGRSERLAVPGAPTGSHQVCIPGNDIDVLFKAVTIDKTDVRGYASVKESGVWVTSSHLRFDYL